MNQSRETLPILGRLCGTTSVISHRLNSVLLEKFKMRVVEMEDVLFHLDSAVFMPENPQAKKNENDAGDDANGELAKEQQKVVTGVEALAIVFKQLEFDPESIVLVTAHADTSGSTDHNFMLTDLRGENVLRFMTGEMDRWAEICALQHNIEDYQQILTFTANKRPTWQCDPNGIDNKWGPDTKKATEAFLNKTLPDDAEEIMKTIEKDPKKKWPVEVWLEVYKIYNDVLKARLDLPDEKMGEKREHLRDRIRTLPQGWVACGEMWPIEAATKDNYRSKENRRVEILIFDEKDDFKPETMQQCIEKKEKKNADKYRALCPIWPFRNRIVPLYIDKLDLDSYVYHLRFVYYDRILKKNRSVPDGLKIRCFEVPKGTDSSAKAPDPVGITTEQIYKNGVYYVKSVFPRLCTPDNAPQDFYFTYNGADTYVYTADDKSEPVIAVKTPDEIKAMTKEDRNRYHALQKEWTSKNCRTFYLYDYDFDGDFEYGDKFLSVVENELKLRPFGQEITEQMHPLTFVADFILDDTPAVILHPALGCPAIAVKDNDRYVLTCILYGVDNTKQADQEITAQKVNDHLKFVNWKNDLDKCCEEDTLKPYSKIRAAKNSRVLQAKRALLHKKPLPEEFNNRIYYTEDDINANIKVTPLGGSDKDGFWKDSDGLFCSETINFIISKNGMKHFDKNLTGTELEKYYHVSIILPSYMEEGCYNLFWLNKGQDLEDLFLQGYLAKETDAKIGDKQEELLGTGLINHMKEVDIDAKPNSYVLYSMPVDLGNTPEMSGIQNGKVYTMTNIDVDSPVCSYHPVYLTEKQHPGIACIGDTHIASRLSLLAKSKARIIPLDDTSGNISKEMEPISSIMSDPFEVVCDLFAIAGNDPDVDVILLTGDLIDYLKSFFPKNTPLRDDDYLDNNYSTPQSIRDAVCFDSKKNACELYQDGIDMVNVYSLFVQFMNKYRKTIYVVAGNHDPYYWPWAISPRVGFGNVFGTSDWLDGNPVVELSKANEGIPADANLTFYEAILAYGKCFGIILEHPNFFPAKFELFNTLFTTFSDFSIHAPKWSLCGLFWGDEEDLVDWGNQGLYHDSIPIHGDSITDEGGNGPGHLPRSDEAVSNKQMNLIRRAFSRKGTKNILMSHFTFGSCREYIPLFNMKWESGFNRDIEFNDHFNDNMMGTFEKNRKELYTKMLFQDNPGTGSDPFIDFVFTGHMHRRGLFDITSIDSANECVKARIWDVTDDDFKKTNKKSAKIFVPDSGGNLPRFNGRGEFKGWGSDRPSLIKCLLDQNNENTKISHVYTKVEKSKPRIAVGFDYLFNIEDRDFIDSFETKRMTEKELLYDQKLIFDLKIRHKKGEFDYRCINVENVDLFAYVNDRFYCASGTPYKDKNGNLSVSFTIPSSINPFDFKSACGVILPTFDSDDNEPQECRSFLSFKFAPPNDKTSKEYRLLEKYNFSSRFNFAAIMIYHNVFVNDNYIELKRTKINNINEIPDWKIVKNLESSSYWSKKILS